MLHNSTPPKTKPVLRNAPGQPARLALALLNWFSAHARDLPWRHTQDPYAIWISEIMLQQTQVKTVIPYWQRWMRALPDLHALAKARPEKVLKLWEGLGYYTRARNIQKAALVLCRQNSGRFPTRFEEVLALPGIGRYTAGAICSIAFNQPTPILDGNTMRVLCRLFGIESDPREKAGNQKLWALAETLVLAASQLKVVPTRFAHMRSAGNCSRLNQALMELGAVRCVPREPDCQPCPGRAFCAAASAGKVEQIPRRKDRVKATRRQFIAFVLREGGRILVRQRPTQNVNGGYWEFPNIEVANSDCEPREAARKLFKMVPADMKFLARVQHTITRFRITLDAYQATFQTAPKKLQPGNRWVTRQQLDRLPLTSAHRKIVQALT